MCVVHCIYFMFITCIVFVGPSTLYNERLVASTPLLNPGERKKQQHLLEREQELTHQLLQLQQHYDLLQVML